MPPLEKEDKGSSKALENPAMVTTPGESIQEATLNAEVQQLTARREESVCDGDASSWQTQCPDPASRLGAMLARGLWFDCEVIVGPSSESIQAHKIILASASSVLANMLDHNPDIPIVFRNMELETFKIIIQYIYTNKIEISSCETACSLYEAARFLNLPILQAILKKNLLNQVSAKCVLLVYEFAKKFDIKELEEKCVQEMETRSEEILTGTNLVAARADTLEFMFGFNILNISSEIQLFKAAERWVLARTGTIPTSSPKENQENDQGMGSGDAQPVSGNEKETAMQSIRHALQKIRFLTLDPAEFAEYDTTSLLTEAEIAAIALNLNSPDTYMPMPMGFSDYCEKRIKVYRVSMILDDYECVETTPLVDDKIKWALQLDLCAGKCNLRLFCYLNDTFSCTATKIGDLDMTCKAQIEISVLGCEGKKYFLNEVSHCFNDDDYDEGIVVVEDLPLHALRKDNYIRNKKFMLELKVSDLVVKNVERND